MRSDYGVIQDFDTKYEQAYSVWNPFFPEAETDQRYYLGDQWSDREKQMLNSEGRTCLVFNYVRRVINMVTGYQRKNRLSSVVIPVENSDQLTADQLSQLLLYVMSYGNGYQMISDCFGGALKTGWNLCSLSVDYRDDPLDGDIRFNRDPYNGFICDPYFTKLDWSDCEYMLKRKYLNLSLAQSLLPDHKKELASLYKIGWDRDDKFTWLPYQRQPSGQNMLAYNEFWEQKWKTVPMLLDMETAEFMEWDGPSNRIGEMLDIYPQLKVVERQKRYVELKIIVNDELMKTEINPYGLDEYPFCPFICTFESESDDWDLKVQSLVRPIRDPQREANRRRSQMIDILDSQLNSGWIADEDSVINPRSLFQTGQGRVIWRKQGAQPGALERIQAAQIPPGMFQLNQIFDKDIVEIAGANDAAFGIAENANDSGVLQMLRQGASLTNLQDVLDNLRFSQAALSRKVLKLVQQWSPMKIKRIINQEPSQQFYTKDFTKYDIAIQEGVLTDTQRQMNFKQMVDIYNITGGPQGSPITAQMLYEAAPLQGKSEVNQKVAQNQQQQAKAAQEQAKVQQQVMNTQSQMAQAKAVSDIALAKERFTRAIANLGLEDERASKSVVDRTTAALDRVKAMKELQSMDDDRLLKYYGLIREMEEMNQREENQIKKDDVTITALDQELSSRQPMLQQPEMAGGINEGQRL